MTLHELPWDKILEVLGFSVGLLYLWWEYHADSRLWFASIVMPTISMWIYFHKGIYADFAINIYYFLIAVYGYIPSDGNYLQAHPFLGSSHHFHRSISQKDDNLVGYPPLP